MSCTSGTPEKTPDVLNWRGVALSTWHTGFIKRRNRFDQQLHDPSLYNVSVKNVDNLPCQRHLKIGSVLWTVTFIMPTRRTKYFRYCLLSVFPPSKKVISECSFIWHIIFLMIVTVINNFDSFPGYTAKCDCRFHHSNCALDPNLWLSDITGREMPLQS